MSHSIKIYDTCIGCTQCVRDCPTNVLEIIPSDGCKAKQISSHQEPKNLGVVRDANLLAQVIFEVYTFN